MVEKGRVEIPEDFPRSDREAIRYWIIGKVMQENAEGLARLEREEPAEERRQEK